MEVSSHCPVNSFSEELGNFSISEIPMASLSSGIDCTYTFEEDVSKYKTVDIKYVLDSGWSMMSLLGNLQSIWWYNSVTGSTHTSLLQCRQVCDSYSLR